MSQGRYWPSLDGLRAVAIALVVAFHLDHLGGGWLGVDIFFVLSGFLITSQLLAARPSSAGAGLRSFWARRARRLLPAVVLLVVVVVVYAWAGGPGVVAAQLRAPAVATLGYVANWQQILGGHGYFQLFAAPDPLVHTWSLAIEEQFYLLWPILLLGIVWLTGRRRGGLVAVTAGLAAVSATWSIAAFHLWGSNRAYLGTDTRAWELLIGAAAAMALHGAGEARHHRAYTVASLVAAAGLAAGVASATGPPAWMWNGGLIAIASSALVLVVACVRAPDSPLARLLALGPVRWVGLISYSLYLWHWPVIAIVTPTTTGLSGAPLLGCRLALMVAAATASYYLVEQPLRRADWGSWRRRAMAWGAVGASAAVAMGATVAPAAATTARVAASTVTASTSAAVAAVARTLPTTLAASPSNPVRFWLFGDSVLNDASPGVTAALQATGDAKVVADTTFPGWSFAHDPQWRSQWEQVIATDHPQVVMATWSWDDQLAQDHPAAYEAFLRRALSTIMTPGNGVDLLVLLQFPQTGPPASAYNGQPVADPQAAWAADTKAQRAWDAAARRVVGTWPGHALYLPTDRLFMPGGRYMAWFRTPGDTWLRARKIDNVHFCPYGAASFGAYIVDNLAPALHLGPMAGGWESGAWVHDPRYNDPPGACPADQPPAGYSGTPVPS